MPGKQEENGVTLCFSQCSIPMTTATLIKRIISPGACLQLHRFSPSLACWETRSHAGSHAAGDVAENSTSGYIGIRDKMSHWVSEAPKPTPSDTISPTRPCLLQQATLPKPSQVVPHRPEAHHRLFYFYLSFLSLPPVSFLCFLFLL